MAIDLSSLFQVTPYPQNPLAQFLQIAFQARQAQKQRGEDEATKKYQEDLRQLQLGGLRRAEAQAVEEQRIDEMLAEEFARASGLRYVGAPGRRIGELRRAGQLATAFERADPRAEARQTVEDTERLVRAGVLPPGTTIPGTTAQAAFPGVSLPRFQGPFADVPGTPAGGLMQGLTGQAVSALPPGAPPPTFTGAVKPITVGMARQKTLGEMAGNAVRPEFRNIPWDESRPIPDQYLVKQAALPESPQAIRQRVTSEVQAMFDNMRQSITAGDVQGAVLQAQAIQRRREEAQRFGVSLPFTAPDVRSVERDVRERNARLTRQGGAEESVAEIKRAIIRRLLAGEPVTDVEKQLVGFAPKPGRDELDFLREKEREADLAVRRTRARVKSLPAITPAQITARNKVLADLAEAEESFAFYRGAIRDVARARAGTGQATVDPTRPQVSLDPTQPVPSLAGQGRVVQTLPPANQVPVGTMAVDNRTGKRFRSDGKRWVPVP